jgi:hypothetical protein
MPGSKVRAHPSSLRIRTRHHPNVARILAKHHRDSPSRRRPTSLLIGQSAVQMLHGEGPAHRLARGCVDPLPPQAGMSIPPGREIECLPVRRPIGPVLCPFPFLSDRDPGAFGNRFRSVDRRDHDACAIWLSPSRKTDPAIVGRESAVKQVVIVMLQQRHPPMSPSACHQAA